MKRTTLVSPCILHHQNHTPDAWVGVPDGVIADFQISRLGVDPIQGGGSHMASVLDGLEFLRHISGGTRPITAEECYMEPGP